MKPTFESDIHPETEDSKQMHLQPANNNVTRACKIVRKRMVMKEKMSGRGLEDVMEQKESSPERDSAKDKQNREKQLKEDKEQMKQQLNKEKIAG